MVPLGFHPAQPQPRSGGEQRRLALACALAGEARLPWLAKGSEGVVQKGPFASDLVKKIILIILISINNHITERNLVDVSENGVYHQNGYRM